MSKPTIRALFVSALFGFHQCQRKNFGEINGAVTDSAER